MRQALGSPPVWGRQGAKPHFWVWAPQMQGLGCTGGTRALHGSGKGAGKEPVTTGVFSARLRLEGGETAPSLQNVPSETGELSVYPPAPLSHPSTMFWGLSPPYTGLCESPEKSPRAKSQCSRLAGDTVGSADRAGHCGAGVCRCTCCPRPGLQGLGNILRQQEKSHLTSAPGAKLRLRKHLLKEGREDLQGMEFPDPAAGGSWCHRETLPALGLGFPICTIQGPVRDWDAARAGKAHRGRGLAWGTQQDGQDQQRS